MTNLANIGKSVQIKGELSGSEDLTIEGTVEGKIVLNGYKVTVGQGGLVMAEIHAKSVVVGGQVRGDIHAAENVEVSAVGTVLGNVSAPRVILADGAQFKGSIDMDTKSGATGRTPSASTTGSAGSTTPAYGEMATSVAVKKS